MTPRTEPVFLLLFPTSGKFFSVIFFPISSASRTRLSFQMISSPTPIISPSPDALVSSCSRAPPRGPETQITTNSGKTFVEKCRKEQEQCWHGNGAVGGRDLTSLPWSQSDYCRCTPPPPSKHPQFPAAEGHRGLGRSLMPWLQALTSECPLLIDTLSWGDSAEKPRSGVASGVRQTSFGYTKHQLNGMRLLLFWQSPTGEEGGLTWGSHLASTLTGATTLRS